MLAPKGLVFTGARARLLIEGAVVGYATGVSGRENISRERLKVLGNIRTKERVAVDYDVTFSMAQAKIVNEGLRKAGFWPKSGPNEVEHLLNILEAAGLTIVVQDIKSELLIATFQGATLDSRSFDIQPTGIVFENVEGGAELLRDESEV